MESGQEKKCTTVHQFAEPVAMSGTLRVQARFMMCIDTLGLTCGFLDMRMLVSCVHSRKLLAYICLKLLL